MRASEASDEHAPGRTDAADHSTARRADRAGPAGPGAALARLRRTIRRHLLVAGWLARVALCGRPGGGEFRCSTGCCGWRRRAAWRWRCWRGHGVAVAVWRWLVVPLSLRLDDLDLAELVERRRRGLGQRIIDVLQLPDLLRDARVCFAHVGLGGRPRSCPGAPAGRSGRSRRRAAATRAAPPCSCYLLAVPAVFAVSLAAHGRAFGPAAGCWRQNVRWPQTDLSGARRAGRAAIGC